MSDKDKTKHIGELNDNSSQNPIESNSGSLSSGSKYDYDRRSSEPSRKATVMLGGSRQRIAGFLISYSSSADGEYWPVFEGKTSIGSGKEAMVQLRDPSASSLHAILQVRCRGESGELVAVIADQQSTNGTLVNGENALPAHRLDDRDIVRVGNHDLLIVMIDRNRLGVDVKIAADRSPPEQKIKKKPLPPGGLTSPYD